MALLPIEHDWTLKGYGIQGVAGKTYLVANLHSFCIPTPFDAAIAGGTILAGALTLIAFALLRQPALESTL